MSDMKRPWVETGKTANSNLPGDLYQVRIMQFDDGVPDAKHTSDGLTYTEARKAAFVARQAIAVCWQS